MLPIYVLISFYGRKFNHKTRPILLYLNKKTFKRNTKKEKYVIRLKYAFWRLNVGNSSQFGVIIPFVAFFC